MTRSTSSPLAVLAWSFLSLALGLSAAAPAGAVTPNVKDDFESGTTLGWGGSTTSNVPDVGPGGAGDNALLVSAGNRVATFNEAQWAGNYISAGIAQLSMDVRHANANIANLQMRIGFANGAFGPNGTGDTYVTNYAIAVPNDDAWHHIVFNISPSDFDPHNQNTNPTPNAATALASLTQLRILHNPTPMDFRGAQTGAEFYLDNIQVVPEPTGAAIALSAGAALLVRRRLRRG